MTIRLFITSTNTNIGKTFITTAMIQQAKARGETVAAHKPIISGFDPANPHDSDTGQILAALNEPCTKENIARISPWRYAAPLTPSMAARAENRPLDFDALITHTKKLLNGPEQNILIETVGGIMSPLTDRHTNLDWIAAAPAAAILVTGTYLGSLSHTLTALSVLQQQQIPIQTIIINESENAPVSLQQTAEELKHWTTAPLQIQHRLNSLNKNNPIPVIPAKAGIQRSR